MRGIAGGQGGFRAEGQLLPRPMPPEVLGYERRLFRQAEARGVHLQQGERVDTLRALRLRIRGQSGELSGFRVLQQVDEGL